MKKTIADEWIVSLIFLWPNLAVQAKRWHDINRSAWHILVNLIPIIGGIWALIQTGFIPGTPGVNLYGSNPLEKVEDKTKKVFVSEESTPYFMEIMMFIVLPVGALFLLSVALLKGNWIVLFLVIPLFIFLFFFYKFFSKGKIFKVITNDAGISFYGLFKEINLPWSEVLSVGVNSGSYPNMVEVKTKNGNFKITIFMKNEAEQYPKFKSGLSGWKLVFADGTKEVLTVENNPLYLEIKNRLKQ